MNSAEEASQRSATWETLSPEEKKEQLYRNQVELLDLFLEKHAISRAQYEKSFHDLTEKMGYGKR